MLRQLRLVDQRAEEKNRGARFKQGALSHTKSLS
jgi:hypothetical protein